MNNEIRKSGFGIMALLLGLVAVIIAIAGFIRVSYSQEGNVDLDLARSKLMSCYGDKELVDELIKSKYVDWNVDWDDHIEDYHKTVNKKFNEYIGMMLKDIKVENDLRAIESNVSVKTPDGSPGECGPDNYSTYCVAETLYSNSEFGYKNFRDIMSCRKYDLYSSALEEKEWYRWMECSLCSEEEKAELEAKFGPVTLASRASRVESKVTEIEEQISIAKQALDKTLATYDQLKTAWEMHIMYIQIYESLTLYRDKLGEIRMPVETYPSKFKDATTTSCT